MPDHIRFILIHAAYGLVLALAFVGMLLAFNVANLWHLVTHTAEGPVAVVMLIIFCAITFGSAQIGYKIMTMSDDDHDDDGGRRDAAFTPDALPIAIPTREDARRG